MAKKKRKFRIKESLLRKILVAGAISGFVSLGGVGLLYQQNSNLAARTPGIVSIQKEVTLDSRAQFYAQNFFQVWIAGTSANSATLDSFYNAIPLKDLNTTPATVSDINVAEKTVSQTDSGDRLWTFVFGATVQSPGSTSPERLYYSVDVVQKDDAFKIVKLPMAVNHTNTTISAQTAYPNRVSENTPLYQVAVNFSAAYLTSAGSSSFGRYVTATYDGDPLTNSPYTAADVRGVFLSQSAGSESTAEVGKPVDALIRVRASTSQATYVHMDLSVRVVKQENGQWLIDGLETPKIGQVSKTQ